MVSGQVERRRGGRPSQADSAALGERILAAAEAAFLEYGFGGAQLEAIAIAAGTSKQTLYARFASKEALFIAVSDRLLSGRFPPGVSPALPLRDALADLAERALLAMLDPKLVRMHSIIIAEAGRFPELARLTDEDSAFPGRGLIEALLADAAARGEILCDDPHRAMIMLQHMVLAAPLRAAALQLGGFDAAGRREWADYAVDLFLQGSLPRDAA